MGLSEQLVEAAEEEGAQSNDPAHGEPEKAAADPFVLEYDTEEWKIEAEDADRIIGLLIAVTNLL